MKIYPTAFLKGQCHDLNNFFEGLKILLQHMIEDVLQGPDPEAGPRHCSIKENVKPKGG